MKWIVLAVLAVGCPKPAPIDTKPTGPVTPVATPDAAPVAVAPGLEPPQPTLRLPKNFSARTYDVRLAIDPGKLDFDGTVTITGEVSERSSVIWLHGKDLRVARAAASRGNPFEAPAANAVNLTVTPRGEDLLELRAERPLDPGSWFVTLEYSAKLDEVNTTGAFRQTNAGNTYVWTQLEAVYARRVFPCIDEPDTKVPWKLAIEAPRGSVAVANTSLERTVPLADGGTRYEFARTRPLPSYLVSFAVGPFDIVDAGKSKNGVPVRIVTLRGRGPDAAYAVKTSAKILDALEEWFGIPYPYDKLDMVTIPLTVGFGAMENAGMITYSERYMLFDQQHPSWARRHSWVAVATHEMAHQWFGDLVTMEYWEDIWLNEGFANWMEAKISTKLEPGWHDELGVLDMRNSALAADSIVSARRIRQPIETPDDILNAFDGITYDKGATVLNMFESYVGPAAFQKGVREYLQSKAFSNATSSDFVAAISKAANADLAPAFSTFLDQAGAPELDVKIQCGKPSTLALTQRRYVAPGSPAPPQTKPWLLPLCVVYDRDGKRGEACTLLEHETGTIKLEAQRCPRWVLPNKDGRGYYRTEQTVSQVTTLRDEAWPLLTWTERRTLFFDVSEAASLRRRGMRGPKSGQLPLSLALSLVPKMLSGGDRFTVGDALEFPMGFDHLVPDDLRPKYEAWLRQTFAPGATKVGLVPKDTDDIDTEKNRLALVDAAVWLGREPELSKQAIELSANWRDLPISIRGKILSIAVDANPALFDRVLHDVRTEKSREYREDMLVALAKTRDPQRTALAYELILDNAIDFRETIWMLFLTPNEVGRKRAEQFFRDHREALLAKMPHDETSGSTAAITELFLGSCDAAQREQAVAYVQQYFATRPGGARTTQQLIEGMDQCIATRKLLDPEIRAWLGGVKIPKPADPKR